MAISVSVHDLYIWRPYWRRVVYAYQYNVTTHQLELRLFGVDEVVRFDSEAEADRYVRTILRMGLDKE